MPPDVMMSLNEDRALLLSLIDRIQATRDFRQKQEATNDLYLSLRAHLDSVEQTVLPMLRKSSGSFLPDSFGTHHEHLRALMSEVIAERTRASTLNRALARLLPRLILHGERERLFLLPAVDRALAS